jgi:hypothetical protein
MKIGVASPALVLLLSFSACQRAEEAPAVIADPAPAAPSAAMTTQASHFKTGEPLTIVVASAPATPIVKGTFVHAGVDAKLTHVRASRVKLSGVEQPGYGVLMTPQKVDGPLPEWQSADPAKRGSFIYLMLEPNGKVYIAQLGHEAVAEQGAYGIMQELKVEGLEVRPELIAGHIRTVGEQTFFDKPYSVDLQFAAPLEP